MKDLESRMREEFNYINEKHGLERKFEDEVNQMDNFEFLWEISRHLESMFEELKEEK